MAEKKKPNQPKHPLKNQRIFAKVLIVIVSIALIGASAFSVYALAVIRKAPELYAEDFISPESTKIYSRNNTEIYDTGLKIRENVSYEDLPQSLIDAFVAVEDSRFFEHGGFDVPRFTKAAIENLFSSLKSGGVHFGQGGSTFTMQLIKNTHFMYENPNTGEVVLPEGGVKGIDRKIQEIYLSRKLERNKVLSKKVILELYLNMINFGAGNNILGIQNSAEAYFGKSVDELNLVESAFLAGVINAPSVNNPYYSLNNATKRTHQVLYLMKHHGYITEKEYEIAKAIPLENLFVGDDNSDLSNLPYQAYIDVVIREAQELTGLDPTVTPMKIYTAMDENIQSGIDKFQRREIDWLDQGADTHLQVGSAVIHNQTGEIIGVVGGYDYNGRLIHNRALDSYNQPGSVIKPVLDYALAFEYLGWATSHVLVDEPWVYPGTDFLVGNYDGRYWGEVTIMDAVADSRNIPALKSLQEVIKTIGRSGVVDYMNQIGFSKVNEENFDLGYALGGSSFLASPIELAGAYTTLMNGGNYTKPHTITRIEFSDGREPLVPQYSSIPVLSDSAAYLASRTMKYAVEGPYPGYLRSVRKHYPVFGKTGTNRWGEEGPKHGAAKNSMKDRLMIAATDQFSMATWVGFDKKTPDIKPWFSPQEAQFNLPGKLNSYLLDLLEQEYGAGKDLQRPGGVADIQHIAGTFPYQSPLKDMNPNLVAKGLIKKEFLNLVEANPQDLKNLKEQKVKVTQSNDTLMINVELTPYPDKEKLSVADNKLVMKYPDGKTTTGRKIYDESWIFGAVRYKTELRVDGKPVKEVVSESNQLQLEYPLQFNEKDMKVCSYYTYDLNQSKKSNEHCHEVDLGKVTPNGPESRSYDDIAKWASDNNVDIHWKWIENNNPQKLKQIRSIKPDISKGEFDMQALRENGLDVEVFDLIYPVRPGEPIHKTYTLLSPHFNVDAIASDDKRQKLAKVLVDGQEVDTVRFSQHSQSKIQLIPQSNGQENTEANENRE